MSALTTTHSMAAAKKNPVYAYPWRADQGNGIYHNPILYADYSDPDAIRVGDDFYLVASSFNCTPGLPILHSKDLVNWTIIAHALKNLPHPRYEAVQHGCGVWAPAMRYHDGKYWIFFPTPDEGLFVITAEHPVGPWSEPHCLKPGKGLIDPCPLWDDDGQAYLVHAYAGSRAGVKHRLRICPMTPDGTRLLGEGQIVFNDPVKHPTMEGPKLYKRNGWYYIFAPAGGVESGWQVVLRSRNIYGPYEDRIVLEQGDTDINGPHQGALVDTADDGWWFLHFQDANVYGRVIHLQPVDWVDDWPVMGRRGQPIRQNPKPRIAAGEWTGQLQASDEFDRAELGLQWQWHANHQDEWCSLEARPGWLRLNPQPVAPNFVSQPNLLLQKIPARSFSVETELELCPEQPGEEAGLVVMGQSPVLLGLRHGQASNYIVLHSNDGERRLYETTSRNVTLRLDFHDGGSFNLAVMVKDETASIPQIFQATKGVWIGAKVGLYSIKRKSDGPTGYADFDYFRFS